LPSAKERWPTKPAPRRPPSLAAGRRRGLQRRVRFRGAPQLQAMDDGCGAQRPQWRACTAVALLPVPPPPLRARRHQHGAVAAHSLPQGADSPLPPCAACRTRPPRLAGGPPHPRRHPPHRRAPAVTSCPTTRTAGDTAPAVTGSLRRVGNCGRRPRATPPPPPLARFDPPDATPTKPAAPKAVQRRPTAGRPRTASRHGRPPRAVPPPPTRTVPNPRRDRRGPSSSQRSATAAHIRLNADGWPSRPLARAARAARPAATRTRPPTPTTPATRQKVDPERGARQTSCAAADAALATRKASPPDNRPAAPVSSARAPATAAAAAASEGPRRRTDQALGAAAPSGFPLGLCRGVTSVLEKKNLPSGKKKPLYAYSIMYYAMLPNVRSKQFASVAEDVRSQVIAQALALRRVLILSPRVGVGSHAAGGRVRGRIQSRRCVAGGVNVARCGCDAAGAIGGGAARCRSPRGSSTDSLLPTALSIPTIRRATGVAAYPTVSPTITARRTSTPAQKGATTALHTHIVQNTYGLVRCNQLRHGAVAPRM